MKFDKNKIETQMTEQIMLPLFSGLNPSKTVIALSGAPYNRIYEHIYQTLSSCEFDEKLKRESFKNATATILRMEEIINNLHPVISSHVDAIPELKNHIATLKIVRGLSCLNGG
jgi:hypothetical protein